MRLRRLLTVLAGTLLMPALMPIAVYAAPTTTVVVRPSSAHGWVFNPDTTTATPYTFTNDKHSIGDGSLYVQPIGSNASDKFIAAKPLNMLASDLTNVSYDFLIAGNGTNASANQFYLNVYTNRPSTSSYYDCRFDYVPTTGSKANFTTASFNANDTSVNVAQGLSSPACPAKLSDMPPGSTVSVIALNVGDTSTSDTGLAGYLDKVVVATSSNTTTYDFEKDLTYPYTHDDCRNGGYATFTGEVFNNQRQCMNYVNKHAYRVKGTDITYTAHSTMPRHASFDMNTASQSGYFHYVDDPARVPGQPSHTKYTAKISAVKVNGNFAYFAGQVTDSNVSSYIGNWVFVKVEKGGSQKIWGSFTSQSAALMGVQNMSNPSDGPFTVTSGMIHINQ